MKRQAIFTEIKKILVVFKTHLDIGYTDFSANVIEGYLNRFIPNAIKTAEELRKRNSKASFRWTTGSWLIGKYLESESEEKTATLRAAIRRGDICWHGLPFTTHTEIMDKELFLYGLSVSEKLDKEFGKKTVAAKMTDVPGHTKAMIPYLKKAGIELLHIGVNEGSAVPEVPELFKWRADTGEEIFVIYNAEYGTFTMLGNSGVALCFAHTLDNCGGQNPDEVEKIFEELQKKYPNAEIVAGDLNDAALALRENTAELPIVTDEIGDSWIHGSATDPAKIMQFRAMERIWKSLPEGTDKEILGKGILMIPEHTCGLDEKVHLGDKVNYRKSDFYSHRGELNYKKMESSWQEQRNYIYDAVALLSPEVKEACEKALAEKKREPLSTDGLKKAEVGEILTYGEFAVGFGKKGEIAFLKKGKNLIADKDHTLFAPMYEQFSYDEYLRFHKRYNRIEDEWVWEDFTKIGMEVASKQYEHFETTGTVYYDEKGVTVQYVFPERAVKEMGAPAFADARFTFEEGKMFVDFAWFNKDANRVAEAIWLSFCPVFAKKQISKLGTLVDLTKVVSKGGRNLCATDFGIVFEGVTVETVDNTVLAPGKPHLVDFVNRIPEQDEGVYFNLYNNTWGTNFPMWYDEDARFRFTVY